MLQTSLTHYAPHDEDAARCGAVVTSATLHSTSPTCPACATSLALLEDAPAHTDADARAAGVSSPAPMFAPAAPTEDVFAFAVSLTRSYAAAIVRGGRR